MAGKPGWKAWMISGWGIFVGSFWLLFGFFNVQNEPFGSHFFSALLPGAGILFMVMRARRHPIPYGAGLILLGVLVALISWLRGGILVGGSMGLSSGLAGLLFFLIRKELSRP